MFVFLFSIVDIYIFSNATMSSKNRSFFVDIISNLIVVIAIFSNIFRRYLKNIYYKQLNIKNIIKFIIDLFSIIALKKIDIFETKNINNLVRNFDIYIYIV